MLLYRDIALPDGVEKTGGWYEVDVCPFCYKAKKFYLNLDSNFGKCHSCQEYVRHFNGPKGLYSVYPSLKDAPRVVRPPVNIEVDACYREPELHGHCAWDSWQAMVYLKEDRGLSESLVRSIPILWIPRVHKLAIRINYLYSNTGKLANPVLTRPLSFGKWQPCAGQSVAHCAWGFDHLIPELTTVVLCEGIFDILTAGLIGRGIAMLGTNPKWSLVRRLQEIGVRHVILWLDNDANFKGDVGAIKISQLFRSSNITPYVVLTQSDPKHYRGRGLEILRLWSKGSLGSEARESHILKPETVNLIPQTTIKGASRK